MSVTIQNFYKATITRNWTATTGDFNVSVAPTVSEGWLVISPNNSTLREIIYFTATGSNAYGPFVTVSTLGGRGIGGTTAQTHTIGESVRMNITAEHWAEMQADINSIVAAGLPAGTSGQSIVHNGSAWVAGNTTKFSTTEVFNGTGSASFADLDLSSVVGVTQKVVLLKVTTTAGNVSVLFKTKGDPDTYTIGGGNSYGGVGSVNYVNDGYAATVIVKTDTSGVIQWASGVQAMKVTVLAYW